MHVYLYRLGLDIFSISNMKMQKLEEAQRL